MKYVLSCLTWVSDPAQRVLEPLCASHARHTDGPPAGGTDMGQERQISCYHKYKWDGRGEKDFVMAPNEQHYKYVL